MEKIVVKSGYLSNATKKDGEVFFYCIAKKRLLNSIEEEIKLCCNISNSDYAKIGNKGLVSIVENLIDMNNYTIDTPIILNFFNPVSNRVNKVVYDLKRLGYMLDTVHINIREEDIRVFVYKLNDCYITKS